MKADKQRKLKTHNCKSPEMFSMTFFNKLYLNAQLQPKTVVLKSWSWFALICVQTKM